MKSGNTVPKTGVLSEKVLAGYRQWIAELDEEAREAGGDSSCDLEVWEQFDPRAEPGRQIYASFTDDDLLAPLIRTMDRPGHKPHVEELHVIYREYLRLRFGGLNQAKAQARRRRKQLADEEKWPPDWPDRVSPQPLLDMLARRGKQVSREDQQLLEELCTQAREQRFPPRMTDAQRSRLDRLYRCNAALELMGIPALNRAGLRHMRCWWAEQRTQGDPSPQKEEDELWYK